LKHAVSVVAVTAGLLALVAPAAHADTPTGNYDLGRQFGNVHRATLYENADGSGNWIRVFGSSPCTTSTSNRDNVIGTMPPNWNDAVSRIYDYNQCDTKLYWNGGANVNDTQTGWLNGGSGGLYVGATWNDKTSSFALS